MNLFVRIVDFRRIVPRNIIGWTKNDMSERAAIHLDRSMRIYMIYNRDDSFRNLPCDVFGLWMDEVNGRTAIDRESVEFFGLGSYSVYTVNGNDFV